MLINIFRMVLFLSCPLLLEPAFADCKKQFCFGVVVPLSRHGEFGAAIRNGITIAQSQNSQMAQSIEFIFEDSAYDSVRALSALKKLAEVDRVGAAYVFGGPLSQALAPAADTLQIPLLTSSMEPENAANHSHVIRFANAAKEYGDKLAQELQLRKLRRVAVMITENPYMNSLLTAMSAGGEISIDVLHRGNAESMDFKAEVTRLKVGEYDAVGVLLHPGQVQQFYRQLQAQKVRLPSFSTDVLESAAEVNASGPSISGAFFVNNGVADEFRATYLAKFGDDDLIGFAALGHDLAVILGEQFAATDQKLSRAEVMNRMQTAKSYQGATGTIRFVKTPDGDKYFHFEPTIRQVQWAP